MPSRTAGHVDAVKLLADVEERDRHPECHDGEANNPTYPISGGFGAAVSRAKNNTATNGKMRTKATASNRTIRGGSTG
jgi:hypothetical protein